MKADFPLPFNLIIAGVGGQGNILASQVIAQAALMEGLYATIGETYGVSQRGGSVMSHVRLASEDKGEMSMLWAFGELTFRLVEVRKKGERREER